MQRARIPGTDLECSRLGFGTWGLGGRNRVDGVELGWPELPRETARKTLIAARDLGINIFDCSDFYGNGVAETLLGEVFGTDRDVLLATKFGIVGRLQAGARELARDFSVAATRRSIEGSLRRLRRDTIDLLQLHGPGSDLLTQTELWSELDAARTAGKIRYIGVSVRSSDVECGRLSSWCGLPSISTVQAEYSVATPRLAKAIDDADLHGKGLLARSVLAHGMLLRDVSGERPFAEEDHRAKKWDARTRNGTEQFWSGVPMRGGETKLSTLLQYALGSPNVSVALVGASSPPQIREVADTVSHLAMNEADRQRVTEASRRAFGTPV